MSILILNLLPPDEALRLPRDEGSFENIVAFWRRPYWLKIAAFLSHYGFRTGVSKLSQQTYFAAIKRVRQAWFVLPRVTQDAFGLCIPYPQLSWIDLSFLQKGNQKRWENRRCFLQCVVYSHIYGMNIPEDWKRIPNEHVFAWWEHKLRKTPCPI